ncbi:HU family DNA-binding protein [Megalodesulfovibrio paquesii]
MNKSELVKALAEEHALPMEEAAMMVDTFFDCLRDAMVRGERVEIRGFGSFKVKEYKSYLGRNPKTGTNVEVPPKKLPAFRAGKELKDVLNG